MSLVSEAHLFPFRQLSILKAKAEAEGLRRPFWGFTGARGTKLEFGVSQGGWALVTRLMVRTLRSWGHGEVYE